MDCKRSRRARTGRIVRNAAAVAVACALSAGAWAESAALEHLGKVVGIPKSDIVRVRGEKGTVEIRLFGLESPQRSQKMYRESKSALRDKALDGEVRVEIIDVDGEGMAQGIVHLGDRNLNLEMLQEGYAWVDDSDQGVDASFRSAEQVAREAGQGVWRYPEMTSEVLSRR